MNVMEKLLEAAAFRKALQCIAFQNGGRILITKDVRDAVLADKESQLVGAPTSPADPEGSDYEFVIVPSKETAAAWVQAKREAAGEAASEVA